MLSYEMNRHEVTAVVVIRGETPLHKEILESLDGFSALIVWDNSQQDNLRVYGRYMAALQAPTAVVYTQDDDCILPISSQQAILDAWEPGHYVANMPEGRRWEYSDGIALIGYGACFGTKSITPTFDRWRAHWPIDELFHRQCDRIFTALNRDILVDVPYTNLPDAMAGNRMWRETRHLHDLSLVRQRLAKIRL